MDLGGAGGLFGDLPAIKGKDEKHAATTASADRVPKGSSAPTTTDAAATTTTALVGSKQPPSQQSAKQSFSLLPGVVAAKKKSTTTTATSMAFVPAALRKRPKPMSGGITAKSAVPSSSSPTLPVSRMDAAVTGTNPQFQKHSALSPSSKVEESPRVSSTALAPSTQSSGKTIDDNGNSKPQQTSFHSSSVANKPPVSLYPVDNSSGPPAMAMTTSSIVQNQFVSETELYDPALPNDLLDYWERQKAAQVRQQIADERAQQMADQAALQQAAADARQALVQAGQYEAVAQQEARTATGRGRGLSNLPAWMVQKQKEQEQKNTGGALEKRQRLG